MSSGAPIRMAIVNDYEVVVLGLAAMLRGYEDRIRIVELDSAMPVRQPVNIALYDTFAQTQGNQGEVRELVENPQVGRVVVYSWNLNPALVQATLRQGACGYLSKRLPAAQLVTALEGVQAGEVVAPPKRGGSALVGGDWPGREEGLTVREAEVLALITQGLSNVEIASRASLSINSVKSYVRTAYRKIGVNSRTNAVLWGIEHGFLPDHRRITRG